MNEYKDKATPLPIGRGVALCLFRLCGNGFFVCAVIDQITDGIDDQYHPPGNEEADDERLEGQEMRIDEGHEDHAEAEDADDRIQRTIQRMSVGLNRVVQNASDGGNRVEQYEIKHAGHGVIYGGFVAVDDHSRPEAACGIERDTDGGGGYEAEQCTEAEGFFYTVVLTCADVLCHKGRCCGR